jgi:hypothetical protein
MAKTRKNNGGASGKGMDPQRAAAIRRALGHVVLTGLLIVICAVSLHMLKQHVERRLVFPTTPPKVVLLNRPAWMSDFLADQLASTARPKGTHSALDQRVLVDVYEVLTSNPWIREVRQVRRAYGEGPGDTIEVDCNYYTPVALVQHKGKFWLVDAEGVLLPESYTGDMVPRIVYGRDGQTNIRIIEGVWSDPPHPGRKWPGQDLRAAIDLVRLLHGRYYTEEILKVDVANFEGRKNIREAQLVLLTKHGTEIRWGQPINAKDFFVEVSAAQKLERLRGLFDQHQRVDANQRWLDIRFDKVTIPSEPRTAQANGGR